MATKAEWEAIETKIVAEMARGVNVGSYTIANRTFTYRSLDEQRRFLQYVQSQIASAGYGADGMFQLARFADL